MANTIMPRSRLLWSAKRLVYPASSRMPLPRLFCPSLMALMAKRIPDGTDASKSAV